MNDEALARCEDALEAGRLDDARAAVASDDPEFARRAAMLFQKHECFAAASDHYRRYLDAVAEASPAAWLNFGLVRMSLGDLDGAAEAFDRCAAAEPRLAATLSMARARLALARGDAAEAVELARSARGVDDDIDRAIDHLVAQTERGWRLLEESLRALNSAQAPEEVLVGIIDGAVELTGADRGFLLLTADEAPRVARNMDRESLARDRYRVSRTVAEGVVRDGAPFRTDDAGRDPRTREAESVAAEQLRSVLCVPLRRRGAVEGALYVDHRFRAGAFDASDEEFLALFAEHAAVALEQARLTAELRAANARLEASLQSETKRRKRLERGIKAQTELVPLRHDYPDIIGRSPEMQAVLRLIDKAAVSDAPVLLQGESGTGKELVARSLHDGGARRAGPFVAVNVAAVSESLVESELFGHVKGAFTGADRDRAGVFVEAAGGTLLLDEVGDMPASMQAKLLRVLQEKEVRPVGGSRAVPIDVRLVCATHHDLEAAVKRGDFREDLFYRINVIRVELPPLRERPEDLAPLCEHFLRGSGKRLSEEARERIENHPWPGNIRQLCNALERAVVLATGDAIEPRHLQLPDAPAPPARLLRLDDALDRATAEHVLAVLDRAGWSRTDAARILGVDRSTLYRLMRKHGIAEP